LRESGDLEQDANVVGFLSENKERDHVIDFTIAKNRNGQLGTLYYDFFKPAMTFTETEVDSYER
jgi:replicative DNA helicase